MIQSYAVAQPTRAEIDNLNGLVVLDFGTDWCGHCRAAQPLVEQALGQHAGVSHLKVEDGPGRALGRSYAVTRWPTLIFLQGGREVSRLVRPASTDVVSQALASLQTTA